MKKENRLVLAAGVAVGLAALALTALGNPGSMGFCIACFEREFCPRAGSSPATRFVLGAFVVIGALAFLGCPLRQLILAGSGYTATAVQNGEEAHITLTKK